MGILTQLVVVEKIKVECGWGKNSALHMWLKSSGFIAKFFHILQQFYYNLIKQ